MSSRDLAWLALVAGVVLLLDPGCRGGCRTVAEHLLVHGLKRI